MRVSPPARRRLRLLAILLFTITALSMGRGPATAQIASGNATLTPTPAAVTAHSTAPFIQCVIGLVVPIALVGLTTLGGRAKDKKK